MSSRIKLTRKGSIIFGLFGALLLTVGAAATIWYINSRDTQVAPTDSDASGVCCNAGECNDGWTYGSDGNFGGGSCGDRRAAACADHGGSKSGGGSCDDGIDGSGCGSLNKDCCPGAGCDSGLSCTNNKCILPNTGNDPKCSTCSGSCGATGCNTSCDGIDPHSCDIWNASFVCNGRSGSGCNSANGSSTLPSPLDYANNPATWCKTYQFDSNAPNGAYSVVFVGDGGQTCVTKGGQANTCNPDDLDWDCTRACDVTISAQCATSGNDASANVSWAVSNINFPLGSGATQGNVVIRLDNVDDGHWHTEGNDTYWGTYYQEFITSGKNPANATWNFDTRTGTGGEYDSVVAGVNYSVKATVYETQNNTNPICDATTTFRCDPGKLQCNDDGCTEDSDCGDGLACTDDGVCRNPACPAYASCNCPVITTQVECNEACTSDDDCKGALICSSGMCRESSCTDEPTCICPTGTPVWKIDKAGTPSCVTGKDTYAQVFYTVTIRNSGDADGELPEVVDTLDSKVQPDWVNVDSIEPAGEVVGNTIVWTFTGDDAIFEPGEEMILTYSVNVPQANFGDFTNVVEGHPTDGNDFSAEETVPVSCVVPVTGIFDSTQSKLIGAGVLLALSAVMVFGDFTDKGLLKLLGGASYVSKHYSKDERKQRAVSKSRGRFEDEI